MRTEQSKTIYLKDYQVPDYLIDETHLTFELFEDHSLVHAQLVMRRNPEAGAGCRNWYWMASSLNYCTSSSMTANWARTTTR